MSNAIQMELEKAEKLLSNVYWLESKASPHGLLMTRYGPTSQIASF